MSRTRSVLFSFIPLALLAGCGDGAAPSTNAASPATPTTQNVAPAKQEKAADASSSEIFRSMNIQILTDKVVKPEEQWKKELTPEEFRILREKGTERAFSGKYWDTKDKGVYRCAGCDQPLFISDTKFDSGCGWPSFFKPVAEGVIAEHVDTTHGMVRTEVTCARCGAHLGHVFEDAPHMPTGLRYCINSVSIDLQKKGESAPTPPAPDSVKP